MVDRTIAPLVLFDGDCNLCNRSVQWLLDHEAGHNLMLASSKSTAGLAVLRHYGLGPNPGSLVVIADGCCHLKSTATLRIAPHLRSPWNLLRLMVVIPQPIRDWIYTWIADNRYWLSQKVPVCRIATPELDSRFLH